MIASMAAHRDFYEDDEPLDDILAARESGEPFVTGPPSRGFTWFFDPFRSYVGVMLSERGGATNVLGDMRIHPC